MNVQEFLNDKQVEFAVLPHSHTFDAQRLAQALHTPGGEVAKTVLLRADNGGQYIVALLPAPKQLDLKKVSHALGGRQIELATEKEIQEHCPDCEVGALPPFGHQYGMQTLVDEGLTEDEEIVFEGNNHREAIRMRFEDFRAIEEPLIGKFMA